MHSFLFPSPDVKFLYFIQNEVVVWRGINSSLYATRPLIEAQQVIANGEGFRQLRTDTRNYRA